MMAVPRQSPQDSTSTRGKENMDWLWTYQKSLELKPDFSFALYGLRKGSPNITFDGINVNGNRL
jgi:hypothetical protein